MGRRPSNSGGNVTDTDARAVYEELGSAVYRDPIATREAFLRLLRSNPKLARDVLGHSTGSKDSRLRQVVARAVWKRPERAVIQDILVEWAASEDDEFTRSAIKDALAEPGRKLSRSAKPALVEALPDLLGTYRYVSSRLRHRTLNALPRTSVLIQMLRRELRKTGDEAAYARMAPILDDLFAALGRLEKAVEHDEDGEYFESSPIRLNDWLLDYRHRFSGEFGRIEVEVDFSASGTDATINAAPYWLVTVFWNLWKNALDATGDACRVTLIAVRDPKWLRLVLVDSGSGFEFQDQERAFKMMYSTKGTERGRGHMEVADAMRRLGGSVRIVPYREAGYRIELAFPRYLP